MSGAAELAPRWRRLLATGIDAVLVPGLSIFAVMVFGITEHAEDFSNNLWVLWVLLLAIASYLLLNGYHLWQNGQTLGKRALGIRIVRATAATTGPVEPAPLWKLILIRAWFFPLLFVVVIPWVTLLPLLDQLLIFGKRRRCLHDYAAGTEVVRASPFDSP